MKSQLPPCQKKLKSQLPWIPLDLTVMILTRLPVESLLKFQFVSKTWCSIIRSKDFINSSIHMSSRPSPRLLISFKNGELLSNKNAEKRLFFFTSSQEEDEPSSLVANMDMTMASMDDYFTPRCASVNGFICLSHQTRFVVCNPSTRQVISLPQVSGHKFLGYDPVNDQYKAMCKTVSNSEEDPDPEHLVLTLGGGNNKPSWRRIEGPTQNYSLFKTGICINGFVYYAALTSPSYKKAVIVCFDVRSETLSFIHPPSSSNIAWGTTSGLINYQGKLAYVTTVPSTCQGTFNHVLCVLQDAKEHQWSLRDFKFRFDSLGGVPISFRGTNKMGEIIIAPRCLSPCLGPLDILYYNVDGHKFRKVKLEGVADDEGFRRRYGIGENGPCHLRISYEDGANFTFL